MTRHKRNERVGERERERGNLCVVVVGRRRASLSIRSSKVIKIFTCYNQGIYSQLDFLLTFSRKSPDFTCFAKNKKAVSYKKAITVTLCISHGDKPIDKELLFYFSLLKNLWYMATKN